MPPDHYPDNLPGENKEKRPVGDYTFLKAYLDGLPADVTGDPLDTLVPLAKGEACKWKGDFKCGLRQGLEAAETERLQAEAGVTIPDELETFYAFSYGADLAEHRILTIPEIAQHLASLREVYQDAWRDAILPFAYVVDVGDLVAFDLAQSGPDGLLILDCFRELGPAEWEGICFGLRNWLARLVENELEPFWL